MGMVAKISITVLATMLVAIPAYAFNWSVDIDRRVQDNESLHKTRDRLEEEHRKVENERMLRQEANMKEMRDDLKQLLRQTR